MSAAIVIQERAIKRGGKGNRGDRKHARTHACTHEDPMATGLVKWWRARFLAGYRPFSGNDSFSLLDASFAPQRYQDSRFVEGVANQLLQK